MRGQGDEAVWKGRSEGPAGEAKREGRSHVAAAAAKSGVVNVKEVERERTFVFVSRTP